MKDGSKIIDEIKVADAHPSGKKPFKRKDYIKKFETLTKNIITKEESERFINAVQNLRDLKNSELDQLNIILKNQLTSKNKGTNFIF